MSKVRLNDSFSFGIAPPPFPRPVASAEKFVLPPQRAPRDPSPAPKRPPAAGEAPPNTAASAHPAPSCRARPLSKSLSQSSTQRRDQSRQSETVGRPANAGTAASEKEREHGAAFPDFQAGVFQGPNASYDGLEPDSPDVPLDGSWFGLAGDGTEEWGEPARLATSASPLCDTEALLDELLSIGQDDGIFEVILPNGQTLGIAVQNHGAGTRLLLSAADDKLSMRLKKQRTELEDALERRMERSVSIAVL